ncbi:MAG: hypothetical protein ACPGF7_09375 [Pontibacterium sp.]
MSGYKATKKLQARRDEVMELVNGTLTLDDMSRTLGVAQQTLKKFILANGVDWEARKERVKSRNVGALVERETMSGDMKSLMGLRKRWK